MTLPQIETAASADLTENQQAQTTGRRRNNPTAPNPAPVRDRPPRDPNFVLYLLRKGYDLESALRIERRITRELSADSKPRKLNADAGADMGGKADV